MVDVIGLVTNRSLASPRSQSVLAKVRHSLEFVMLVATIEMYFNFIFGTIRLTLGDKSYYLSIISGHVICQFILLGVVSIRAIYS